MSTPSTIKQNKPVPDAQTTNNEQSSNNDNNDGQTQQQQRQRQQQQPQPQSTWQLITQTIFRMLIIYYVVSLFKGKFRLNCE